MNRPNDIVIQRVLNNKGTIQEAKEVAVWFGTVQGQAWLKDAIDKDALEIDSEIISSVDIPSAEMVLKHIYSKIRARKLRYVSFAVAAVLIPCAIIIGAMYYIDERVGGVFSNDDNLEFVAAAPTKKKEIYFQDGSFVMLNSASSIEYPHRFGLSQRRVKLFGEAYFNIKPNSLRPFIVELEDKSFITVLGTSFNVEAYSNSDVVKVELLEGSLQFQSIKGKYQMEPLDRLIYNKLSKAVIISHNVHNISNSILWRDDLLVFNDIDLEELLNKIERAYDVEFIVEESSLYKYKFTMNVNLKEPLNVILQDIENISKLRFNKLEENNKYIVTK